MSNRDTAATRKVPARAYRHGSRDGGTLHANLLAVAGSEELQPRLGRSGPSPRVRGTLQLEGKGRSVG